MTDLIAYVRARLADAEKLAQNAIGFGDGNWTAKSGSWGPEVHAGNEVVWAREVPSGVWLCDDYSDEEGCEGARWEWMQQATFIAANNPAAALADIAVKRRILDEHPHVPAVQQSHDHEYDFGCQTCHNDPDCGETRALGWCDTAKLMALPYSMLPGFEEDWEL